MSPRSSGARHFWINRALTVVLVGASLGSLWYTPSSPLAWLLDGLGRGYLLFLCTVMAHEAVHGNLGRSKAANLWWGRLSLIPVTVPFTNFRRTHMLHHAHTNEPDGDPDIFMKPRYTAWEIPLRALAMPHQWFIWLYRRGKIRRGDVIDLALNYLGIIVVYIVLGALLGPGRLLSGMLPAVIVVSLILWYPFALKTHEGWSVGREEARSHDYYGRGMFWMTLGLSMHRAHHLYPKLAWLELLPYVRPAPGPFRLLPRRDVLVE